MRFIISQSDHILLELEARRLKFDRHHTNETFFKRITTDITHFNINALPSLVEKKEYNVIGVSKHM